MTEKYKNFRKIRRLLYIQNFDNRTYAPQLTGRLKEKLQSAFTRKASIGITPDKQQADLILYGKILLYTEEPGVFDRAASPLTYNLTMVASMKLRPRIGEHGCSRSALDTKCIDARTVLEDGEGESEQHTVRSTTTYSIGEPLYETRYTAEERLLEGLADRLVNATYEP